MRITSIQLSNSDQNDGLKESVKLPLGNVVILAGKNGSGKTRLIKRLEKHIESLQAGIDDQTMQLEIVAEEPATPLSTNNANEIELVNYSHYDAMIQPATQYSPYVISHAKNMLKRFDYGVTALNAFLFLEDLSHGYSEDYRDGNEWRRFKDEYLIKFDIALSKDPETNKALLFERETESAALSPGQQYLLRMAVACYCNENNDKVVFILDEPELHLHPKAQINLIEMIRGKFPNAQIWVATHSIALISFLLVFDTTTTLLHLFNGEVKKPRSDLSELIRGLVGSEDNLFSIRQLLCTPEEYVCNRFAVECKNAPDVSGAVPNDPQIELIEDAFWNGATILDFGAGKCRMLEEIASKALHENKQMSKTHYIAYEPSDAYEDQARELLDNFEISAENYYSNIEELCQDFDGKIDCIFMVNVLHEIHPQEWASVFSNIQRLLKKDVGELRIIERSELTIGEAPYKDGFLMITPSGADELFGIGKYELHTHSEKKHIVAYVVKEKDLQVTENQVKNCISAIKEDAEKNIVEIKGKELDSDRARFKSGLKLAFYTNQFANASILCDKISETIN